MTFFEKHRSAIYTGGLGLALFMIFWMAYVRGARAHAEGLKGEIATGVGNLAKYYPEISSEKGLFLPKIEDAAEACTAQRSRYRAQLKELTGRLRFPFHDDKVPTGERPGIYVSRQVDKVGQNVYHYKAHNRKTSLAEEWLDFYASEYTGQVTEREAEESLRRLALAERVTKLAIDSDVRWVMRVKPQKVTREAARVGRDSARFFKALGYDKPPDAYNENAFIVNYPVEVRVIGPVDSIQRFFHGMRGDRQFLVIRAFTIVSEEDEGIAQGDRELMQRGDVLVTISAACMDFEEKKVVIKGPKTPTVLGPSGGYQPPKGPRGF